MRLVLGESVQVVEVKEAQANDCNKNANDIALACPLPSLAPHEVFGNHNLSVFILLKLEPWHLVEHRIHEATGANYPSCDGDGEPCPLVQQNIVRVLDDESKEPDYCHSNDIFHQDLHKSELKLDIGPQVVVDEVDLFLSIENLSAAYEPLVSLFIHRWDIRGPLWVLSRHSKIWYSHQSVILKY